ncbi:MAG: DEAD/DEAH box helicase [Hymenobacter sp.]
MESLGLPTPAGAPVLHAGGSVKVDCGRCEGCNTVCHCEAQRRRSPQNDGRTSGARCRSGAIAALRASSNESLHKLSPFQVKNTVLTLPNLPVVAALPELLAALETHPRAVLEAPPGAGKTTVVPLALLAAFWRPADQKILVLEPRQLAVRAAAARLAQLLGEPVGRTVGYRVRLDSKVSAATRIEVMTEGILTRMLQDDPALEDVACVVFDEFHERSLNADLGLALALDAQGRAAARAAHFANVGHAGGAAAGAVAARAGGEQRGVFVSD